MVEPACCSPGRPPGSQPQNASGRPEDPAASAIEGVAQSAHIDLGLVAVPGGTFTMGANDEHRWPADREGPARAVHVDAFSIGRYAVTNDEFAAFVDATGHTTDAERFGWSFVFDALLPEGFSDTRGVASAPWWRQVEGADWQRPVGPQSTLDGMGNHPVVHVSFNDATSFCSWADVRLPSEAEWERAARGGLENMRYPWGDDVEPNGTVMCNIFVGDFPSPDRTAHGPLGTAPVDAFSPNGFGLHNVAGNVWEWCSDLFNPAGASYAIRGGSYLCHDSYCDRYRVSARSSNEADSSTDNMGFRVAL